MNVDGNDRIARRGPLSDQMLVNIGWLGTGFTLLVIELPFKVLLKEQLHLTAEAVAGFLAIASIPYYVKPFAGILSDAVPLFGTRRRSYLLGGLILGGLFYLLLSLVPRNYSPLLASYFGLTVLLTVTSTVLGGVMVEVGKRECSTGRLSAQRFGILRVVGVISGPLAGWLAGRPFLLTSLICGGLYFAMTPIYWIFLREDRSSRIDRDSLREVARQTRTLIKAKPLWAAAGLVVLVVVAPGFDTALLYHQTDHLHFSKQFIGTLEMIKAAFMMVGAVIYGLVCSRLRLREILLGSILIHATMTLWYLVYRSPLSAVVVTAIESTTFAIAMLPLYDLAARATPPGSEALGYSAIMSVWNLTKNMSDLLGASLYSRFGLSIEQLVWVNVGTTAVVLIAVPFLPAVLVDRTEKDPEQTLTRLT